MTDYSNLNCTKLSAELFEQAIDIMQRQIQRRLEVRPVREVIFVRLPFDILDKPCPLPKKNTLKY